MTGARSGQSVPGTVARGQLRLDELLYTGKENGVVADKFPFPITRADLERGRQRYNIYCTPCHDYTGSGHGHDGAARISAAAVVITLIACARLRRGISST